MAKAGDSTEKILQELEALGRLLNSGEQDNIPILDEPIAQTPEPQKTIKIAAENPFLPKAMLERLTQEREAAQHSAEEAHRTMQRVMERKQEQARQALTGFGRDLTNEQKDALISQIVDEMLPQIADRLRDKLKFMLNR